MCAPGRVELCVDCLAFRVFLMVFGDHGSFPHLSLDSHEQSAPAIRAFWPYLRSPPRPNHVTSPPQKLLGEE